MLQAATVSVPSHQNLSEARVTSDITALHRTRPQAARALDDAVGQSYLACPDQLLDLCRARVHMLLGGQVTADDPRLRAVADYARSDLFSDTERLVLEFAEQYVLDVANMPDDLVAQLQQRLGTQGAYALAMALYAIDQAERLALSAAVHPALTR